MGTPTASVDNWYANWKIATATPPPSPSMTIARRLTRSDAERRTPNTATRTRAPTTGRSRATVSGGTPMRKRCTEKMPEDPHKQAAAIASR